jgi:type II secretory pathway pseudopilin PulG
MSSYKNNKAITLIEVVTVVAIVAIMIAMVMTLAGRFENLSDERTIKQAFVTLSGALTEFSEYGYRYNTSSTSLSTDAKKFYANLKFPLDCPDDLSQKATVQTLLTDVLGQNVTFSAGDPNLNSGVLYFFLSRVPEGRIALAKIDRSLITNKDDNGDKVIIEVGVDKIQYPFLWIIDPWNNAIRYDYYDEKEMDFDIREDTKKTFPLLRSAGPDGVFSTSDDITSGKQY